jgi:hypothetical protein
LGKERRNGGDGEDGEEFGFHRKACVLEVSTIKTRRLRWDACSRWSREPGYRSGVVGMVDAVLVRDVDGGVVGRPYFAGGIRRCGEEIG